MSTKTLGENRVRIDFNLTNDDKVNTIKAQTANLINQCEDMRKIVGQSANPEVQRLVSLAQTAYEEAAMWAVKAVTF